MVIKVMYHSKKGSTKKVAEAIAGELGVSAEVITENSTVTEPVDFLFIGDGVYMGTMNKLTSLFIQSLEPTTIKKAVAFGTFGSQKNAVGKIKDLLVERGIQTNESSFSCKGKAFLWQNKNHPDENDLFEARKFARDIVAPLK